MRFEAKLKVTYEQIRPMDKAGTNNIAGDYRVLLHGT